MGFGAPREENVWKIDDDGTWLFDDEIMNVDTKDTTYHYCKKSLCLRVLGSNLWTVA